MRGEQACLAHTKLYDADYVEAPLFRRKLPRLYGSEEAHQNHWWQW